MTAAMGPACNLCGQRRQAPFVHKDGFDIVRCDACQLLSVSNPPTDAERERLYSFGSGYHEGLTANSASVEFHTREATLNLKVLRRHAVSGRLLDIGCSTGLFLAAAREAGWPGEGLEYSPDTSEVARRKGLDVKTGELRADTFAPGSFDVVTLWDVIEHLPDPQATLKLIAGIMAPGGLLVLKTPNADGLYPQASLPFARRFGYWGHAEPPGHLYQFSVATLSKMVEQAGFEIVSVIHQRIPIGYSFGSFRGWFRSLKWALYCAVYIPLAWIGPGIGRGDDQVLVARKRA